MSESLSLLDGAVVSALEKVGSHNLYGKDAVKLEVSRKGHNFKPNSSPNPNPIPNPNPNPKP